MDPKSAVGGPILNTWTGRGVPGVLNKIVVLVGQSDIWSPKCTKGGGGGSPV